jgi:aminoglycoside phosphotransferase (APT) family kinase protein
MQGDFSGTESVRRGQEISNSRLSEWLLAHVPGYVGPLKIEQFKGGQSNPTYKLITPSRSYVLRRKPSGLLLKGAHAIEREYRVTAALASVGYPVAGPLALCTDEEIIGTRFFVMNLVDGRIFWDPSLPGLTREDRAVYFDVLNTTLASLHSLDPNAIGLEDYGKSGNYFQRQILRWSRQYQADDVAGRDVFMDRLVDWLPSNIPPGDESRVVHGDFRADNLVFDVKTPSVLAVLDWELSTIGHPLADFTYHLMMYRLPPTVIGGFNGANLDALGIPNEAAYVRAYCDRTGRERIENLEFYMAFNLFRFAAIMHGIKGRIARGTASSAHAQSMADQVGVLARLGWEQASS